jgi:hypothetical protein
MAANRYSVASNDWNNTATWSATSGGAAGASAPIAGDNVFIEGNYTVNINSNVACANISIVSTATLRIRGNDLTVSGTTTCNGTISFTNSSAGTKIFNGRVTISSGASWTNTANSPVTFRGGITNNGTFSAGTASQTFNTNNQSIDGSSALTLPAVVVTGITLTNASVPGLTVTGTISGTGSLTNGSATNNAILNLTVNGDPLTLTGTIDFTTYLNTVNFNGTGAQTVAARNFYNLTISGARAGNNITLSNGGTVKINGTFSPVATFSSGNYVTTNNTIEFGGSSAQSIPLLGTATYNNITISGGGTKSLTANTTVGTSGILRFNGGVLELGSYNLTVSNNAAGAIAAVIAYSQTNMISTGGTGYLQRNGNAASSFQNVYPVGSGGYYSPMTITTLGTVTPTYLRVRSVPTAINPGYILTYWDVSASAALNNVTATFQYDAAEANGASNNISYSTNSGVSWQNPPSAGTSSFGTNSFTITGTNPFNGWWTMGYRTYYSYQTGNWSDAATWTSDPSGTLQVGTTVPGVNDYVVILSGRTVSMSANIASTNIDLTINDGGFLNMSAYSFTSGLLALRGQGTLQLASASFPVATTNTFVSAGGGTTEYQSAISLPVAQTTYNNLKINSSGTIIELSNLTLNGNLDVVQGRFQINDNTTARRQLTINGNVTVASGATIGVGTGVTNSTPTPTGIATTLAAPFIDYYDAQSHRVVVMGDFTNNGSVKFTNLTYPVYNAFPPTSTGATTGFATVYFRGATNNRLTCNGTTDFYNLVVDKGSDQTYTLTITASAYANFRLFGANIAGGDITAPSTASNPNLKKALWIRTGTLSLEGYTVLPSLSEGSDASAPALNFIIPSNASLKLNGPDVIVQSTADVYQEVNAAYGVAGGSGLVNGVIAGPNESGMLVLGKLEVVNGFLSTKESRGILYSSATSGKILISGGTIDTKQFRSNNAGTGLVDFTMSGGTLNIRGRFQLLPSAYSSATDLSGAQLNTVRLNDAALLSTAGAFSIENTSDVFTFSGGTINIYDVPAAGATSRSYEILTSSANYNITGGTVVLIPTQGTGGTADATPWLLTSTAPIRNLTINRAGGSSVVQTISATNVSNNLTLQSGALDANSLDLTIGGNFTINSGTTYTTGTNTTIFNGSSAQTLTDNLASPLALNNLKIDKAAGLVFTLAGTQTVLNVSGTLSVYNGTLNDNGNSINVAGNLYNSSTHTGTGKISLNGTGAQTIDGNGSGIFQNLELNNTNATAVALLNNITINGTLTFSQNRLFNISTYGLTLSSTSTISGASSTRYIQSAGALGNGGLTKAFSAAGSFTFPVGVANYTPATIALNGAPTSYGSITVVPVNYAHPNVTVTGRSLSYFWRVRSSGITLGSATVTSGFTYADANVVTGTGITEDGYVAARYNTTTHLWSKGTTADVDETNNIIGEPGTGTFLENSAVLDGDYTAGDDTPTNPFGTQVIYYSRQSGNWGTAANWSLTSHTVTNAPASPPGASDIVVIGNGNTITFGTPANYLTNPNTDPHSCASLQVEAGAVLDIRYNPSSVFSMVQSHPNGNGTIRIAASSTDGSTFAFPSGDFSDFNRNLGTTELYSTNATSGTTYWLPNGIGSYGNLIISPLGGSNIIFPNNNLTVLGNLIMKGQNADSWFCPTWSSNYPTAPTTRVAKTITVMGNFDIQGGSFGWYGGGGGGSQDIIVNGDVIVAPNAGIDVWSANTSQSMMIGGSLINNSTNVTVSGTTTVSYVNLSLVPVTFFGNNNASITNTAGTPRTVLGTVTVNKGNSPATTLTLNVANVLTTPTNGWLNLQNGTFRYMVNNPPAGANFTISTTTPFSIPSTAGLYINYANANNVTVLIGNAANNNGDLLLSGKLTIISGSVLVGPTTAADNNNDIEYSGSGASEIDVQGGTLVVNGNIRRSGTSGGILKYSQSGSGSVTVNGRGTLVSNAKLEILNSGSTFNMSGTSTLTIVRGGGTSAFGDLYLRPASSSVTGGSIIFQTATGLTAAERSFKLDANVPLNNLTITGSATDAAAVTLMVNPLVLAGYLTISNTYSSLVANSLDVSIGGNFTNSGTYTYGTNTTRFTGSTQSILGTTVTNFYNLQVAPSNSLTVNNNFTVNGNLNISGGTLILAARRLTLLGSLSNNGTYTDDNATGGISLTGSSLQQVSGTGAFGRLELNNSSGARLSSDITLQNNLVLTNGRFDINANLLTLQPGSNITGSAFGLSNMIVSDGVASSQGVRKFFNVIAAPTVFTYPLGVSGKYTPATFTINANGAVGYINVKPVNNNHPAVVDPNNVLKYYWTIESSGITGFSGAISLKYLSSDVRGTESSYIAARLLTPGTSWSKATPGPTTDNVDESTQTIAFTMPAGTNNLNGDYTAGTDSAIPDDVPTYISVKDGNWSDQTVWAPVGAFPPCPVGGPNGFIVIIDHQVNTDVNYCFAYSTTINNKLTVVNPTFGHNLGLVDGNGTIVLGSGNLPAGNYASFLTCGSSGTLEYGGSGNYSIIASQFSTVPNLSFTGTGVRVLPNRDLTICNRLLIDGPVLDNSVNNRGLVIRGSMEKYNSGAFRSGSGSNATISFQGLAAQTFGGTGSFSGTDALNNLEINNGSGLTLGAGSVEVAGNLLLTNGIITTTSANRLVITNALSTCVTPSGGSTTSFVAGPLTKSIPSGSSFIYPIGSGTTVGHAFTVTAGAGSTVQWTAEYLSPNSTATAIASPLQAVNTEEYWNLSSASTRTGYIRMAWDEYSAITPLMTQNGLSDMRAAYFGGGNWQELTSTISGNNLAGDVTSTNTVSISSTATRFSIGSVSTVVPRASMAPAEPVCGSEGIPVQFSAFSPIPLNYALSYSINGIAQAPASISALPYALPTPVPGTYQLTGFTYNNGVSSGVVDPSTVSVYALPTTANAGRDSSLCGVSGLTLSGNNPSPYTGQWTIISGTGGTLVNSSLYNTTFTGTLGGTYTLRWTISNVSCTSTDDVIISFPVAASRPGNFTTAPLTVCQGTSGIAYTVPNVPGYTYNWSYSGTGCTINGTGSSVTCDFSPSATGGTLSVTATNSCGTSTPRSISITVNPLPVATFNYSGTPFCPTDANPSPVFSGGGIAGTFSSTAGLVFISTATGQINISASTPGTYTVTNTISATTSCIAVSATSIVTIRSDQTWTGAVSTDWNNSGNWSCGYLPTTATTVLIPVTANQPVLNLGAAGAANDLTIASGATLSVTGNTISVAGTITNSGTFNTVNATVAFVGTAAQTINSGTFTGNQITNLTVNNTSGVTLAGPLGVAGIVRVEAGNLASGGNLTLVSTAAQTALVDGSVNGTVSGAVTMQRYLPSGFGYKYLSSPFTNATVAEFSDDISLGSYTFYRYDESKTASGWVGYSTPANSLNPLEGYAVNLGSSSVPNTIDLTGTVNSGSLTRTLYNNNNLYTKGFNLAGNPYPSPVDWNASTGWTRANVDNAVYYFKASTTDQYGGTYSTYINGVSSDGVVNNIIPSMQAFFVHVSDGSYPVTGTLGMDNRVRITDLTHPISKALGSTVPILRLNAGFESDSASADPVVIYFDENGAAAFDKDLDALKLFNTDLAVPNLYTVSADGNKLSINALPLLNGDLCTIPLGLKLNRQGTIVFRIKDEDQSLFSRKIYLTDMVTGTQQDLQSGKEFKIALETGEYTNRFYLNFETITTGNHDNLPDDSQFSIYSTNGILKSEIGVVSGDYGTLRVYNLAGQLVFISKVYSTGYHEFGTDLTEGIYIVNYISGTFNQSRKLFIEKR